MTIVFITIGTICFAQEKDTSYFKYIIQALAHDSMQGRAPGTIYETKSANFIIREIQKIRQTHSSNKTVVSKQLESPLIQNFTFLYDDNIHKNMQKGNGKNVYCKWNNNADTTIIISAHYDHIGLGQMKSMSYNEIGKVHNGADDNASGVAMALMLLKNNQWDNKKYNYIFVFYSGHELGLHGSKAFEKMISKKVKHIFLSINFDMLGRLDVKEKILTVYGHENFKTVNDYFVKKFGALKIDISESQKIKQTDGLYFYNKGIFSLSLTTGTHMDYHKTSDDEKYINYFGMHMLYKIIADFLKSV